MIKRSPINSKTQISEPIHGKVTASSLLARLSCIFSFPQPDQVGAWAAAETNSCFHFWGSR
jgi:hypothetical protein